MVHCDVYYSGLSWPSPNARARKSYLPKRFPVCKMDYYY
jgi:hypothetical protein